MPVHGDLFEIVLDRLWRTRRDSLFQLADLRVVSLDLVPPRFLGLGVPELGVRQRRRTVPFPRLIEHPCLAQLIEPEHTRPGQSSTSTESNSATRA